MDGLTLLKEAHDAGLKVSTDGETLTVRGPKKAEHLARTLLTFKADIMPLIRGDFRKFPPSELAKLDICLRIVAPDTADSWTIEDWLAWIEERSAIMEFDANHSRHQADEEAFLIWRLYRNRNATE